MIQGCQAPDPFPDVKKWCFDLSSNSNSLRATYQLKLSVPHSLSIVKEGKQLIFTELMKFDG